MYMYSPVGISLEKAEKVAAFDLDWTLVKPKNTVFPRNTTDNYIMTNRIPLLKKYIDLGYTIVIFSNQKLTPKEKLEFKIARMNDIINKFSKEEVYPFIFMATGDDGYRKPNVGMWTEFRRMAPNIKFGFYCGDMAGRPGDHSDSDLQFAKNIPIDFYIPEVVFGV